MTKEDIINVGKNIKLDTTYFLKGTGSILTKPINFEQLQETLYHEKWQTTDVYVLPKQGFNKTYAVFTTKYGSIDNQFVPLNKEEMVHVPDGIAHFLEHKLFEKADGDVFQDFSKQGASANAFTSFTRTAYLFSSTSNVEKTWKHSWILFRTRISRKNQLKRKRHHQEINMYDDNPDWRLFSYRKYV